MNQVSSRLLQSKSNRNPIRTIDLNQFPNKDLAKSSNACCTLSQQKQDRNEFEFLDSNS